MSDDLGASKNSAYAPATTVYHFQNLSTAFNDSSSFPQPYHYPPDIILVTRPTYTAFFTHYHRLVTESNNQFGRLLESCKPPNDPGLPRRRPIIYVDENEHHFNCFLIALYNWSSQLYKPDTGVFSHVFNLVIKYGFKVRSVFSPSSGGFQDLVRTAETEALRMYTLAAHWDFEELAVSASRYVLRVADTIQNITDDHAETIGPRYLLRLIQLHETRKARLKELLLIPPTLHVDDTPACARPQRLSVLRAYGLAAGYVVWEKAAGVTVQEIKSILFGNIGTSISCPVCSDAVQRNIDHVLDLWSQMKDTI
ncbi:uncharacterized protein EI90DRAFT_1641581 [Cantharellus anzutake]|uniref:uncharacterized protein n=1 Tax=Cantharellus anzutake TaxID=1750568 RepID=UPI001907DF22|nr:uncharacterized protein EI90DRAFT_1641581 [Cantharellus anzutake]KAF8327903.1 hypothetical protein EI90DRAFT_1641581 [Cantharellus anzutake]